MRSKPLESQCLIKAEPHLPPKPGQTPSGTTIEQAPLHNLSWDLIFFKLRRPVQTFVLFILILLPWGNASGFNFISGSFFALNVGGIPFTDPLNALQVLTQGYFSLELWIGAAIVFILAILLGRFFCGWVCPYGLLSELVYTAQIFRTLSPQKSIVPQKYSFLKIRWAICLCGIIVGVLAGFPALLLISMPGNCPWLQSKHWKVSGRC